MKVQSVRPLRVLFLGTTSRFSLVAMDRLLAAGTQLIALVVPQTFGETRQSLRRLSPRPEATSLPLVESFQERHVVHRAWRLGLPVWAVHRMAARETVDTLTALAPDVACVACFPRRIPPEMLQVPGAGFLNLHPSLLPCYRGPVPLFWMLREGEHEMGVTVHFMDEELDTGDIVSQQSVTLPDGISGVKADEMLAVAGAELMVGALRDLAHGRLQRRSQPPGGRYDSWPAAADFSLSTGWPARRAFNFMRGTAEWQRSYPVWVDGSKLLLRTAVSFDPDGRLDQPMRSQGRDVWLQFNPGILHAR